MATSHFVLIGNGPYGNRGCEAIVRGTVAALEHFWGSSFRVTVGTIAPSDTVAKQARREADRRVEHVAVDVYPTRLSAPWCLNQLHRLTRYHTPRIPARPSTLRTIIDGAAAVLSVGGDNYSLHYDVQPPYPVYDIGNYVLDHSEAPLVIWGASIGPFTNSPRIAKAIVQQLRRGCGYHCS
jgi:colanic acid/amylovoran biosynthesis protein